MPPGNDNFDQFKSLDWSKDVPHPARTRQRASSRFSFSDATQSWLAVVFIGATIGVISACMTIITVWLSDIKLGYCAEGWWLNRKLCCEGLEDVQCEEWHLWALSSWARYAIYILYAGLLAWASAFIVKLIAPLAAGSGISEIKCYLSGFELPGFLSSRVMFIKSVCLPIAIASGLSVGKEGPSVHMACAAGHSIANLFSSIRRDPSQCREAVTAASAAGVAVAFGSPIGGVLFAFEEMSLTFPITTLWKSLLCALVSTVTLSIMNPLRTGKLVLFQVEYHQPWHSFELTFFVVLGIFGALYGAFVMRCHMQIQAFRKRHLPNRGIIEATLFAVITAVICFPNEFLRIDMNESLELLFSDCQDAKAASDSRLCVKWARWRVINELFLGVILRTILVIFSYGAKIPAGIFVPSMAVGALFGRMLGMLLEAYQQAYPTSALFENCPADSPCISPGTYALLGAAAGLAGITRISVTVVVIMFELTGAFTYIIPTMVVVMAVQAVSYFFDSGGIAVQMIHFNKFPALEPTDALSDVLVQSIMASDPLALRAVGPLSNAMDVFKAAVNSGFSHLPVVDDQGYFVGQVQVSILQESLKDAPQSPDTLLLFVHAPTPASTPRVDLAYLLDVTALSVSASQSLDIVLKLFGSFGPKVIYVERAGILVGTVTAKDCLRHENQEHERRRAHHTSPADEVEILLEDIRDALHSLKSRVFRWFVGPERYAELALEMEPLGR